MQREFWKSLVGHEEKYYFRSDGWTLGFVYGVMALTRFMNRKKAVIEYVEPKHKKHKR